MHREFSCGSLKTPEAESRFLENLGYYRKHIALNSTCLFRAVSEYEHGIQMYHGSVRQICLEFMRKNKQLFAKLVKGSFTAYLANLALTCTYGSLLELTALAMFYKADVVIYEPFTTGRWYYRNTDRAEKVWRLFVCRANHFDSVYPLEHMQEAAFCQSLVYEVLYKGVLQIPDVEYAVERMLYDPENITTAYGKDDQGQPIALTGDGRQLVLSRRDNTKCILSNFQLCHFHNNVNFTKVRRFFLEHGNDAGYHRYGLSSEKFCNGKKPNPLLMGRDISCVRQLLNEGVMPFTFKAAKALDTYMYRNVEFDVWRMILRGKAYQTEREGDHTAHNDEPISNQLDTGMCWEGMNQIRVSGNVQFASLCEPFPFHTLQGGQIFDNVMPQMPERHVQEERSSNHCPGRIQVQYYDNVVNRQCQMDRDVPEMIQKPSQTAVVNSYLVPLDVNSSMPLLLIPPTLVPYENWPPFAVPQSVSPGEAQLSEANANESHLLQQQALQYQLECQQQQQPHPQHGAQLPYFVIAWRCPCAYCMYVP